MSSCSWLLLQVYYREIINGTNEFWYFNNGTPNFFFSYYQWYPRIIERFTIVTFLNVFRPISFKIVNFLLCFELKNKEKEKHLREIINGTPVFLHFIFGTLVFFRLSMVSLAFDANYNRDIIQVFVVILSLNPFKNKPGLVCLNVE